MNGLLVLGACVVGAFLIYGLCVLVVWAVRRAMWIGDDK